MSQLRAGAESTAARSRATAEESKFNIALGAYQRDGNAASLVQNLISLGITSDRAKNESENAYQNRIATMKARGFDPDPEHPGGWIVNTNVVRSLNLDGSKTRAQANRQLDASMAQKGYKQDKDGKWIVDTDALMKSYGMKQDKDGNWVEDETITDARVINNRNNEFIKMGYTKDENGNWVIDEELAKARLGASGLSSADIVKSLTGQK